MDKKQLTLAISILTGTFLFLSAVILILYYTNPSLIGFAPPYQAKSNKIIKKTSDYEANGELRTASVMITLNKLITLEEIERQKLIQDSTMNSFTSIKKILNDSIVNIFRKTQSNRDSMASVNKKYQDLVKANNTFNDSLNKLVNVIDKAEEKIKISEQRIKDQETFISRKQDTVEKKNFLDFAKMYNTTKPQDVARILEQIDERDAARILKLMQPKKASKVIESMAPEQAAAILLLGATK
jgi:flagellar motility protein MotE (MotC chaperone)